MGGVRCSKVSIVSAVEIEMSGVCSSKPARSGGFRPGRECGDGQCRGVVWVNGCGVYFKILLYVMVRGGGILAMVVSNWRCAVGRWSAGGDCRSTK